MVVSRLTSCRTRDFSVLYSKDLTILNVKVEDVFGLERLVRTSEVPPSPDMIPTDRRAIRQIIDKIPVSLHPLTRQLFFGVIDMTTRTGTLILRLR